jgi:hypothetical protein
MSKATKQLENGRQGWRAVATGYRMGKEVAVSWMQRDIDSRTVVRFEDNWNLPLPYYISSTGTLKPTDPPQRFATLEEAQAAAERPAAVTLIRVPAKFFNDHEERDCEPCCEPIKRSERFVWLRLNDPGLAELLDDARHYGDDDGGPDAIGDDGGLVRSAKATVKAIEAAL